VTVGNVEKVIAFLWSSILRRLLCSTLRFANGRPLLFNCPRPAYRLVSGVASIPHEPPPAARRGGGTGRQTARKGR
jgi:hypothetical protein